MFCRASACRGRKGIKAILAPNHRCAPTKPEYKSTHFAHNSIHLQYQSRIGLKTGFVLYIIEIKCVVNETDCFINTISNGRRFAGGFFLTPKAIANDGLLDVCMIKKLSLLQRFSILLKVPKGNHVGNKRVNYYQTNGLNLSFPDTVPFHVDGELNFASQFEVNILPGALNIIYNRNGNHFFS